MRWAWAIVVVAACSHDDTERWCNVAVDSVDQLADELRARTKDDATACRELAGMGDYALAVALSLRTIASSFVLSERAQSQIDAVANAAAVIHMGQSAWLQRDRCVEAMRDHPEMMAGCVVCPRADDAIAKRALSDLARTRDAIVKLCAPSKAKRDP